MQPALVVFVSNLKFSSVLIDPALTSQQNTEGGAMMMMMIWFAVAIGLFLLRPRALRNNPDTKPTDHNNGPVSFASFSLMRITWHPIFILDSHFFLQGSNGSPPPMAN